IEKQLPDGTPETTIRKRKERAQKIFYTQDQYYKNTNISKE
ncbi:26801_t:CDS:1, partial [Dentiscutata erythropus]